MAAALSTARRLGAKNLVGFEVDQVAYAVDIQRVREVIRPLPTVELPGMPKAILGVADHRGAVMPVIDLRLRLGVGNAPRTWQGRWVVVDRPGGLVALVVDRVTEVFGGEASQERNIPDVRGGDDRTVFSAVYGLKGSLVFVLDVDVLTAMSEEVDISMARAMLEEKATNDPC